MCLTYISSAEERLKLYFDSLRERIAAWLGLRRLARKPAQRIGIGFELKEREGSSWVGTT